MRPCADHRGVAGMSECGVVVNKKRRCRLILEENGNLCVEEYFEKGQMDRGRVVKERGWVRLWSNIVAYEAGGTP